MNVLLCLELRLFHVEYVSRTDLYYGKLEPLDVGNSGAMSLGKVSLCQCVGNWEDNLGSSYALPTELCGLMRARGL